MTDTKPLNCCAYLQSSGKPEVLRNGRPRSSLEPEEDGANRSFMSVTTDQVDHIVATVS